MPSPPRSPLRIVLFAVAIAVVFGSLVSAISVLLAPRQAENAKRARQAALQSMLACDPALAELLESQVDDGGGALEAHVVELDTGCYATDVDATTFDVGAAAADPAQRLALAAEQDIAGIGERPDRVVVYEVRRDGALALLVLPVYGMGYQSRLEGYLSLADDLETVSSLVFHTHGESPGMGARIGDPAWQATWCGKRIHDESGAVQIGVALRDSGEPSPYQIDAMSGATKTGRGVTNLLHFWLGELGYARLIGNLQTGAACVAVGGPA